MHRHFWKKCCSMTLSQDKRGTRLLSRWRAATPELEMKSGTLALSREVANVFQGLMGADSTRKATMTMLMKAVTSGTPPCRSTTTTEQPQPDVKEYKHLTEIIEVFAADAAADEQNVGRQLGKTLAITPDVLEPVLPNLYIVAKDKAHAARRRTHC